MRRVTVTCLILSILVTTVTQGGVIHRRGGVSSLEAPIIAIDDAGVQVRTRDGSSRTIAWDLIRALELDWPDPMLDQRLEIAKDLWRARSRLQRNDPNLAEPLFERLFEKYRGQTNESARIVAEGLLRCRLARGAHVSAVIPFLETLRLHRAGVVTDRYDRLSVVFDDQTDLCPQLAPVWADVQVLNKLHRDLAGYEATGDEVVNSIATLYELAVRTSIGEAPGDDPLGAVSKPSHEGLDLLFMMLQARLGDREQRSSARQRMLHRQRTLPDWAESWIRYSVGMSYLAEADPESLRKGLVSLAHVPARFAGTHPYLAGLALAKMASTLADLGRPREALSLRAELQRRFPGHPLLFMNDQTADPSVHTKENP